MNLAYLPERGVLRVTGTEARSFLDRLVTNDMDAVKAGHAGYGALLTPQGKIIGDFLIVEAPEEDGGGFLLDVSVGVIEPLLKKLALYKLRADVQLSDLTEVAAVMVAADGGRISDDVGLVFSDPRHPSLGDRVIVDREEAQLLMTGLAEDYHFRRISIGIPDGGKDFVYGEAFPHEALLDQVGGVSFSKGCYVGQEVVSRMQHRGNVRTRSVPVTFIDGFRPEGGAEAFAGEKPMGFIGTTIRARGMGMLRLDRASDAMAAGDALTAGGLSFRIERPDFVNFPLPGEPGFGRGEA